jgi:curved DNA-binding protein CbpA
MTINEYILKYNLDNSNNFNENDIVNDLFKEFLSAIEEEKPETEEEFYEYIFIIRTKFEQIKKEALFAELPINILNKFQIKSEEIKLKLFPEEKQKEHFNFDGFEFKGKRKKKRRTRRNYKRYSDSGNQNSYRNTTSSNNSSNSFRNNNIVYPCFKTLGFNSMNITKKDVIKQYRKLSMIHHPDKGGNQIEFVKITEAKESCLKLCKN